MRRSTKLAFRMAVAGSVLALCSVVTPSAVAAVTGCSAVGHRLSHSGADAWFTGTRDGPVDTLQTVDPQTAGVATISTGAVAQPGMLVRGWLHVCRAGRDVRSSSYAGSVDFVDSTEGGNPFWSQYGKHSIAANGDQVIGEFFQVVPNDPPGLTNHLFFVPRLHFRDSSVPGTGDCALPPRNQCFRGPVFVVNFGNAPISPPGHIDGPGNATCGRAMRFGYAAAIQGVFDNSVFQLPIPNGSAIAAGHSVHVRLAYCANTLDIRLPAIALKFLTPPGGATVPWESAPTIPNPLTRGRLHEWLDGGSIYQTIPFDLDGTSVYAFIPRLLSSPGELPDDNVLAQGGVFRFTVCARFDGVTCL